MNLYLLLVTLTIVNAGVEPDTECDGVIFDGKYYDKEILKTDLIFPDLLTVDYSNNIIFFSYISNDATAKSALLDLNTKEFKDIKDVPNAYAQTVDQNTHDVYIGGTNGLYKYDHKNHKSELYAEEGKSVLRVFFKDVLYLSEYLYGFMYTYIDGNIEKCKDLEDIEIGKFVIDGEDVIFYNNDTGLYAQKKGSKDAVLYSDKLIVRALAVDAHGNAYMCTEDAIYRIDKKSSSLEKLMDVDVCGGLAFDSNDNVIYSSLNALIYLRYNKDNSSSVIFESHSVSSAVLNVNITMEIRIFLLLIWLSKIALL